MGEAFSRRVSVCETVLCGRAGGPRSAEEMWTHRRGRADPDGVH